MDQILNEFERQVPFSALLYRSMIYQPERVSLNSSDDNSQQKPDNVPSIDTTSYNNFRIKLVKPCLNVKSVQLLRASVPTPITNIPDSQTMFFYYEIPNTGAPNYAPNYAALNAGSMRMIRLLPSSIFSPDRYQTTYAINRTFADYQDLVDALNIACIRDPITTQAGYQAYYTPNDIQFIYDPVLNKIRMIPAYCANPPVANPQFYYVIAGYDDPNIKIFLNNFFTWYGIPPYVQPGFNLNTRLGYTWDGLFNTSTPANYQIDIANHMNPAPNYVAGGPWNNLLPYRTADTYANLVYSACMYLYVDWIGGSSEDSQGNGGLLGVIPLNTANNAVGFFNNVLANPLTKIPSQIHEVEIRMVDEVGNPFYLPNSAIVNLELGFSYV